ncbi:MAG: aldehyde dehydrogenase family protein [Acidimicrobiales bacterium]
MTEDLEKLEPGQPIVFGGNRLVRVDEELARRFTVGDRLVVVESTGDLLHIPAREWAIASSAVGRARAAFDRLGAVDDGAVSEFFELFARHLADDDRFAPIARANRDDVVRAVERGRSTTRLELGAGMRSDMIAGLRLWRDAPSGRDAVIDTTPHDGWLVERRRSGLGVVGFVFEGRPNVFADACGVVRSGNTVVFRIGSDALGTARAIVEHALDPALAAAGLPPGTASLVDSPAHAAGWAMFSNPYLALAVARGSGPTVEQLGAVARQVGTPVSLHGTGGAWIITGEACDPARLSAVVRTSLDRKVCNTLNTCCVLRSRAAELVPVVLDALTGAAQRRGAEPKLHVTDDVAPHLPEGWLGVEVEIARPDGPRVEARAETITADRLGHEWEWENSPEITLTLVDDLDDAVERFNRWSPRFAVSVITDDEAEADRAWARLDAPFVGDGFTRWVDGQFAFDRPELGLSNWQHGRLLGRAAVLSGDSVHTVRARARQHDAQLHR